MRTDKTRQNVFKHRKITEIVHKHVKKHVKNEQNFIKP